MSAQIVARDVAFAHGPATVLDAVTLTIADGHRVGIVGPNGVGKSTLLGVLCGELEPASGSVVRVPGDASVGHLTQELHLAAGEHVDDVVRRRLGITAAQAALDTETQALADGGDGDGYDAALEHWLRLGGATVDHRLDEVLDRVGLDPRRRAQAAATLSGGERARVNLACVLLAGFDILALDEPTNDLDLHGLALLEDLLVNSPAGYVLVSHDRAFLRRVVTSVFELDEHSRTGRRYTGSWDDYLDATATERRHAEEAHATYTSTRDQLRVRAQRQREWADKGRSRATKAPSDGDKFVKAHNVAQTEKLAGKAKATERAINRLEVVDKPWESWDLRLEFPAAGRSGDDVVVLRDVIVDRGLFRFGPLSLDIGYGERIAVVGANGSGKSTLLDLALGRLQPDAGAAHLGPAVTVGTLDQGRGRFWTGAPLLDAFVEETGVDRTEARSQLAKLGLGADHVARPTAALSPGERTRAVLAAFALVGVNLLVLDEPTNHLDLVAIEQLEAALEDYPGTLVLVTHDRAMLDVVRVTRRIEMSDGALVADDAV